MRSFALVEFLVRVHGDDIDIGIVAADEDTGGTVPQILAAAIVPEGVPGGFSVQAHDACHVFDAVVIHAEEVMHGLSLVGPADGRSAYVLTASFQVCR